MTVPGRSGATTDAGRTVEDFNWIELILVGARVATGEPGPASGMGDGWKAAQIKITTPHEG